MAGKAEAVAAGCRFLFQMTGPHLQHVEMQQPGKDETRDAFLDRVRKLFLFLFAVSSLSWVLHCGSISTSQECLSEETGAAAW